MREIPLTAVALAPLLLCQGLYTRIRTPKLPEAAGVRTGAEGSGPPLGMLILGDSAAAGVGVDHQRQALSGQLVSRVARHFSIDWRLEAATGMKTREVVQQLERMEAFDTDVVIVSLGVNDVTSAIQVSEWLQYQKQLRNLLVSKFKARHILLSSVPPMNRFPALPQPLRWYLGQRSEQFNAALSRDIAGVTEVEFIDVEFPAVNDFIASDGFHPSQKAYAFWSDIAAERLLMRCLV